MYYAKSKREKKSICNLCRVEKELSWDHVPPKGGIELTTVQMETIHALMIGNAENKKLRESQNGMKYRTICGDCNAYLGTEFDPTLNDFALSVGGYLQSTIKLPDTISHKVKPQRLMKAILGHIVAAKVEIEDTLFDQQARAYVLDIKAPLPKDIHVFYWLYPHDCSITMRDFIMPWPRGTLQKAAIFQTLKYCPIAYLCCDKPEYAQLDNLSWYRNIGIDDDIEVTINLRRTEHQYWPEAPSNEENNIVGGGKSAANSVHAISKR